MTNEQSMIMSQQHLLFIFVFIYFFRILFKMTMFSVNIRENLRLTTFRHQQLGQTFFSNFKKHWQELFRGHKTVPVPD